MEFNIDSIIGWAKEHEQFILENGVDIPLSLTKYLAFHNKQKELPNIKIYYIDKIPLPKPFENKANPRGLALGNGIYIDKAFKDDVELLKHELIHIIQSHRYSSLDVFIKEYFKNYFIYGYFENPFEIEARKKSKHPIDEKGKKDNLS